jgi:hypothetical protein
MSGSNGSMKQTLRDEICIVPFEKEEKKLVCRKEGVFAVHSTAHMNA